MVDKKSNSTAGISFTGMLFLLFLGLKLGKVIDWSWWWVFSPLWIIGILIGIMLITGGIIWLLNRKQRHLEDLKRVLKEGKV